MPNDDAGGRRGGRGERGRNGRQCSLSNPSDEASLVNTPPGGPAFRAGKVIFVGRLFWPEPETWRAPLRNHSRRSKARDVAIGSNEPRRLPVNARILCCAAVLAAATGLAGPPLVTSALAEMTKMVGGAPMYPSRNIIENAV